MGLPKLLVSSDARIGHTTPCMLQAHLLQSVRHTCGSNETADSACGVGAGGDIGLELVLDEI